MEHQIDGVELVSKKVTKQRFRASIFEDGITAAPIAVSTQQPLIT
jgi:hypothetical protein